MIEDDGTNKYIAKELGEKYGDFDVIIDDGSHHPTHQILSLLHYLPYLKYDGIFIIEDIITKTQRNYLGVFNDIVVDGEVKEVKLFEDFFEEYNIVYKLNFKQKR